MAKFYQGVENGNGYRFKIQAEDAGTDPDGKWSYVSKADGAGNQSGFQGDGYYVYGDPDPPLARNNVIDDEILTYRIEIPEGEEGIYTFRARVSRDGNAESDKENDLWLNFSQEGTNRDIEHYLVDTGDEAEPTSDGFVKVFGGPNNGSWGYASNYDGLPGNPKVTLDISKAGIYEIQIAGRSEGYHLDSFELYSGKAPASDATDSKLVEDSSSPTPPPPADEPGGDVAEDDSSRGGGDDDDGDGFFTVISDLFTSIFDAVASVFGGGNDDDETSTASANLNAGPEEEVLLSGLFFPSVGYMEDMPIPEDEDEEEEDAESVLLF
ncbi:MAG: hypothetical protein AAFR35_14420 [Pseudomonadota bacterium]